MKICDICNKEFVNPKAMTNHRRWHKIQKYTDFQKSFVEKTKGTHINVGENHPMWKKHHSEKTKQKLHETHLGEKNPMWKGEDVGYNSVHEWVRNHKLKPKLCEICNSEVPFDLANISGKYKRDMNDYQWLCRSCHMKLDYKTGERRGEHKNNLPKM